MIALAYSNYSYIQIFIYDRNVFKVDEVKVSQVYVSGFDEVDRVMIWMEMNMYIVYILNYYIL